MVGVGAEGSHGARSHGSMRGMGGGAGCVRGKGGSVRGGEWEHGLGP